MSTQSGITVSNEVLQAFKSLKHGGLIIRVSSDNTQLVPDTQYKQDSTSLQQTFKSINEYLSKLYPEPAYVIIAKSENEFIFISFIPDNAPIKQKMIYASTKNSLLLTLGGDNFNKADTFAWTELDELTYSFYESQIVAKSGPLTVDEQVLQQINDLQDLTLSQSGFKKKLASMHDTSSSVVSSGGNLRQEIHLDLQSQFDNLPKSERNHLISFHIENEVVKLVHQKPNVPLAQLVPELDKSNPDKKPQYAIYSYDSERYTFIYSCPSGSKVKDRMIYAASKLSLINHVNEGLSRHDLKINKSLEVGDLDELELSELDSNDSTANSDSSSSRGLRFNKPKGPRRR